MVAEDESHSIIQFEVVGLRPGDAPEVAGDMTFVLKPGFFHFPRGSSEIGRTSLLCSKHLPLRVGLVTRFGHDISSLRRWRLRGRDGNRN